MPAFGAIAVLIAHLVVNSVTPPWDVKRALRAHNSQEDELLLAEDADLAVDTMHFVYLCHSNPSSAAELPNRVCHELIGSLFSMDLFAKSVATVHVIENEACKLCAAQELPKYTLGRLKLVHHSMSALSSEVESAITAAGGTMSDWGGGKFTASVSVLGRHRRQSDLYLTTI